MLKNLLEQVINAQLITLIVSNPRKSTLDLQKYKIRPLDMNGVLQYQLESFTHTQSFHKNLSAQALLEQLINLFNENLYKQVDIYTEAHDYHILINKKGEPHIKAAPPSMVQQALTHNRKKEYILEEGKNIPFLIHLGVMTQEGKIVQKKYDKFKQINRYLEMIEDILPHLASEGILQIVDFGCGKSYLTFALYYYLVEIKKLKVHIVGLDLKQDVIEHCNALAQALHYENLVFKVGDIGCYTDSEKVDLVITLHACDTATDMALQKAIGWGAKVIMSVPCCQHELNQQIQCDDLQDILQYGIIKERISALLTDAMRANWLSIQGYEVQILEFIDMAHTPKNLLIRAVKRQIPSDSSERLKAFQDLEAYLSSDLSITK